jgi:Putative heavy-metal-binding
MKKICVIGITLPLVACVPAFVDVVDVRAVPTSTLDAALKIPVFPLGTQAPANTHVIAPIEAYSCKHLNTDPPATTGNALQQLQIKALQVKANAIINVTFDTRGTDVWGTNCWQTVTASGVAVTLP